ncbi:MAG: threonine aldolase family protein [Candidatus Caldatribacteriaceae bacterium]
MDSYQREWIDLRSDTVTHPTPEMLRAMVNARVGDDVYEDDPTVQELEALGAEMVGKESSLFVPSGTFGNQLAILTHTQRGDEVIIPEGNHIVEHEVGAPAVISSVQLRTLQDDRGRVSMEALERLYREEDIHHPRTGLVCMENAHSSGSVVPLENMQAVYQFARLKRVPVHLDGARIFNAACHLKVDASQIAQYADSVMFCLSKGLCAPAGSLLAGSKEFIKKARKMRKLMGGGMRQVGYLAAPGIVALQTMTRRLEEDHQKAQRLAHRLSNIEGITVFFERLDINMVFFRIERSNFPHRDFVTFLLDRGIKINPPMRGEYRLVTHYWVTYPELDYTASTIAEFMEGVRE